MAKRRSKATSTENGSKAAKGAESGTIPVTVYVKPDCATCTSVLRTVEQVGKNFPIRLNRVDISQDDDLSERFPVVPVILINEKSAFEPGRSISDQALKKRLSKVKTAASVKRSEALTQLATSVRMPRFAPILMAITLIAALYFIVRGTTDAARGRARIAAELLEITPYNKKPPPFSLATLQGKTVSLDSLRGKVTFLNFWATWCPPCVEEMPSLLRLHERMKDNDRFVMLAVSADEDQSVVRKFFGENPPPFQVLLDQGGAIAKEYGTEKFPETYVLKDGKVVGYIVGPRDWDTWYAESFLRRID